MTSSEIKTLYSNKYAEWIDAPNYDDGMIKVISSSDKVFIAELEYRISEYKDMNDRNWIEDDNEYKQFVNWLNELKQ